MEREITPMIRTKNSTVNFDRAIHRGMVSKLVGCSAVAAALLIFFPTRTLAQEQGQKTYPSAEEASRALYNAAQNGDKELLEVLGPAGKDIISSGDPTEDETNRTNFVQRFGVMHRLVTEPDGTTTLYVGVENWPVPIPLASNKAGQWYFDTTAAKQEILYRRIGQNEMSAIRICQELAAAEKDYFAKQNNEYAAKFVSDEGKHNGLYWLDTDNQFESPIGPLVANAGSEGGVAKNLKSGPVPFRGYYFRILDRQGKHAPGGSLDYIVDGKMTKGFAFEAYPAAYRDSGVMTFIVGQDGVVYQKDLGTETEQSAKSMTSFDPDKSWAKSEEPQQTADNQELK
jgi:Protein of unknown function (DUF2950)